MESWPSISAATALFLLALHYTHLAQANRLSLPPSWTFSPDLSFPSSSSSSSSLNSYPNLAPFSLFVSILSSSSFDAGSKGFSLGFLSLFHSSSSSPTQIYLSICLGVRKNGALNSPFMLPVWTLNNSSPLKQQGEEFVKLRVNDNRELLLEDGDGRVLWTLSNVQGMEIQANGNLIIFDSKNDTIWQSFDNPSDTLLQGQKLRLGMEIASSNHVYKGVMQPGGLMLYLNSEAPLPLAYWLYAANKTVNDFFITEISPFLLGRNASISMTSALAASSCAQPNNSQAYAMLDGEYLVLQGVCTELNNSILYGETDLLRLDDDGYVREYHMTQLANSSYMVSSTQEKFRPCYTPNVCGAYGICSTSTLGTERQHQCRCPSEADNKNLSNAFAFIDVSNPSQGCRRTISLDCKQGIAQSFVEIKNTAFISMPYLYELTWRESTIPLEKCMAACSSNCSCTGIFYHTTSSYCLPFGDSTAMSNLSLLTLPLAEYTAFIKIQTSSGKSSIQKYLPAIIVAPIMLAVFTALIAVWMYHKWKQDRDPELKLAERELLDVLPLLPTRYSYQELIRFTKGFSKLLGSGGFGSVYEGVLPDARRVAVKRLEVLSHGQKEFLAEIATIGGISHVNIVRLYGFCLEKQYRLLVYEYMQNGALDKCLFHKEGQQNGHVMSWETRFNVALGTARGLAYLHEDCPKPILHFDVKPQNILLDEEFNAKLADFGLSKLVARGATSMMTAVRGTPGYIAPEWVSQLIVSKKCDVYSFGMVLLELVSGRRNAEMSMVGTEEWYFPKWAMKKGREGKVGELLDKRIVEAGEDVEEEQVRRVVGVALLCIQQDPNLRPSMSVVCGMLDASMPFPKDALDSILLVEAVAPLNVALSSSGNNAVISNCSSVQPR